MTYRDMLTNDFTDPALQIAFRTYFEELGIRITNWAGLFAEMAAGDDTVLVRRDQTGMVTGFIQFTTLDMSSWFFRARCGFIREFWIRADLRRRGHGSALLQQVEDRLRAQDCMCALLTTDTAPAFYCKRGYTLQTRIEAQNRDDVYMKLLT